MNGLFESGNYTVFTPVSAAVLLIACAGRGGAHWAVSCVLAKR